MLIYLRKQNSAFSKSIKLLGKRIVKEIEEESKHWVRQYWIRNRYNI